MFAQVVTDVTLHGLEGNGRTRHAADTEDALRPAATTAPANSTTPSGRTGVYKLVRLLCLRAGTQDWRALRATAANT